MLYIFLSHDVDWRKQGPEKEHILARKERFDDSILKRIDVENLYYNFSEIMETEEKLDVRSTFFFRTLYENGNYLDYEEEIKSLQDGGWEIGLHSDGSSINSLNLLQKEKANLEMITKQPVVGNRVHYLQYNNELSSKLSQIGFEYDSTMKRYRDQISVDDMNYRKINGILEFPITIMDTYLFSYLELSEKNILNFFKDLIFSVLYRNKYDDISIITLIWHDNVLKMKGGRMYKTILEFLTSINNIIIKRGIDLVDIINRLQIKDLKCLEV